MRVLRLTTDDAETWSRVGDGEIFVSDIVDEAGVPDAKLTVGFARVANGEALDTSFPYDEVIIQPVRFSRVAFPTCLSPSTAGSL